VLLFAELMEMVGDEPHAFDRAVLLAFRSPTDVSDRVGPSWLELVFLDITSLGGAMVLSLMTAAVMDFCWWMRSVPLPCPCLHRSAAARC
jgi:undecaprenyl-diphosphatase